MQSKFTAIELESITGRILKQLYQKENVQIKAYQKTDLENNFYSENGTCYALRDHIGILVDGTVVPCCLDNNGDIPLGNIFDTNFSKIISCCGFPSS